MFLSTLALLALTVPGMAAAPAPTPAPSHSPAAPSTTAIPLADVAARAAEVSNVLQALTAPLGHSAEIETIRKILPEFRKQIDLGLPRRRASSKANLLWTSSRLSSRCGNGGGSRRPGGCMMLTQRATLLGECAAHLSDLRQTWRHTRDAAQTV